MKSTLRSKSLIVRVATREDIPGIAALSRRVWGAQDAMTPEELGSQQRYFPEGQFVVEYEGEIVGHCATFRLDEGKALSPHDWHEITGGGLASRHEPDGDFLYGMEVCVDPRFRGLRIGQRLYDARRRLCQELGLKGIVFGGRMPGYARRKSKGLSPEDYLNLVFEKRLRDPVVGFQIRNGFTPVGVLPDYLPSDQASEGYASLMVWRNPRYEEEASARASSPGPLRQSVRVASVQFQVRKVTGFDPFMEQVEYFIDVAADYRSDFVLFPELFTIPLLSAETPRLNPHEGIQRVADYTEAFVKRMQELAISYNINIVGGTQPTRNEDGDIENVCYVFLRDGSVHSQAKLHPTPSEREWWNIKGGNTLSAIDTDCGPIGVLVCYDSEFPEAARRLTEQGALLLFVPFCTDERQGYNRVRYCCHARAVENQMYVITAGVVGNLPDVENMDIHYAESSILTPCDFPFARDGVAATSAPNTEMVIFADLRLDALREARHAGTVQNLRDRRFDLYSVRWTKRPAEKRVTAK